MYFALTEDQQEFAAAVRGWLAERFDLAAVRGVVEDAVNDPGGDGNPAALWKAAGEQGWLAVTVPEEFDGLGLGLVEALGEVAAHGGAELLLVFGECEEHPGPYRGKPSTRSAVTLRWTWLDPPQIVTERDHMAWACSGRRSVPSSASSVACSPSRSS